MTALTFQVPDHRLICQAALATFDGLTDNYSSHMQLLTLKTYLRNCRADLKNQVAQKQQKHPDGHAYWYDAQKTSYQKTGSDHPYLRVELPGEKMRPCIF